jgi:hypothetical protein
MIKRVLIVCFASLLSLPLIFVLVVWLVFLLELWSTGAPSMHALTGSPGSGFLPVLMAIPGSLCGSIIVGFVAWGWAGRFSRRSRLTAHSSGRPPANAGERR